MWELFDKILKIRKNIEINFLKNFRIFHEVKIVNININMVISRRVNPNASLDVPKPLYQWGGCASPLIQSFGCTDSARALRRTSCTQGSKLFKFVAFSSVSSHFIFFWGGGQISPMKKISLRIS